ncbi:hypothetical protein B0I26_11086 [Anoxybacillus vitaminiphilus]|uniref:Uncharacterized protein n=1 Tax=Paranoxybacillus vitaminiphilus TaxID=581036 RepID=A0A327YC87_9BACL|nr:hypothetical protein [Anoxybacillus vitaminiphilus]RAK18454.1 hypothetical protein B0I26_11086 [Anoxybacillus vitaminiphilus]
MDFAQKPKFAIGDIVVNTLYGTVGTITDIKMLDGTFLYEINHSNSLFLEHTLILLSDFDGHLLVIEEIEIELPYFFGEIVQVKNQGSDLYKIVGVRTEIWRYQDERWEEVIYELTHLTDGKMLEASPDELTPIAPNDHSLLFVQDIAWLSPVSKDEPEREERMYMYKKSEQEWRQAKKKYKELIDELLDTYNDYQRLYEWFHDEEYKKAMEMTLKNLQNLVTKKQNR